ncbi:MAG: MerR family transcriptional regulator, light-induced transcriptional regulator [Thermoleophilaceae bacterium]|nr:MerR family transcriptional regulator, light-induced transcriptional regulator [Thermoleophilaceae bacterium]
MADDLTIREVAARTGVNAATLRMWEQRFGFPDPARLESGHRRYSDEDVEQVRRVARDRAAGLSIPAAIERARSAVAEVEPSIYAGLRRRRPDLIPYLLPKRTLIALSHAIEDECAARAERPVLFGSFQRPLFYRHAQARWRELSRTAATAIVFAEFDKRRDPKGGPHEIPIAHEDPLLREWGLVCDAPDYTAFLAAWERPGQDGVPDSERVFETIWSVEPELVREAARVAAGIAEQTAPDLIAAVRERMSDTPPPSAEEFRLVGSLTNRMVAYVGQAGASGLPAPHASAGD